MKKILVVDDNAVNRQLILEVLREHAECVEAVDGVEAFEKYQESADSYDLALLDIAMPRMDGIELLRQIRRYEEQRQVLPADRLPVILVTAFPDRVPEGMEEGAIDYLVKPLFSRILIVKVEEHSKKR